MCKGEDMREWMYDGCRILGFWGRLVLIIWVFFWNYRRYSERKRV